MNIYPHIQDLVLRNSNKNKNLFNIALPDETNLQVKRRGQGKQRKQILKAPFCIY